MVLVNGNSPIHGEKSNGQSSDVVPIYFCNNSHSSSITDIKAQFKIQQGALIVR